jgi:hypothetical protein
MVYSNAERPHIALKAVVLGIDLRCSGEGATYSFCYWIVCELPCQTKICYFCDSLTDEDVL